MVARTFVEGGIANERGDLWGSSPLRIIRSGKVVIAAERAGAAIMMGWRAVEKAWPDAEPCAGLIGAELCDPAFAWIER